MPRCGLMSGNALAFEDEARLQLGRRPMIVNLARPSNMLESCQAGERVTIRFIRAAATRSGFARHRVFRWVVAPVARMAFTIGNSLAANSSAAVVWTVRPIEPATAMLRGLPSFTPVAFLAAKAAFVRSEISRRSFSASAA
jgi:hypothetical protein